MKISFLAFGSNGDVFPAISICKQLEKQGHEVTIVATVEFEELLRNAGIAFKSLGISAKDLYRNAVNDKIEKKAFKNFKEAKIIFQNEFKIWLTRSYELSKDCDLFLYNGFAALFGNHIAEKLGVPSILVNPCPFHVTSAFADARMPVLKLGRLYNKLSYPLVENFFWTAVGSIINEWRLQNGLRPVSGSQNYALRHKNNSPKIFTYSEHVSARPKDWHENIFISGYCFPETDANWKPSDILLDFLASGSSPVFVGYGSMSFDSAERTTSYIIKAIQDSGQRAIMGTGWGGIKSSDTSDNILILDEFIPYNWIFPKSSAIIHHGGAGTTSLAVKSGAPSIITPMLYDQFFWAHQIHKNGYGSKPIELSKLNTSKLIKNIKDTVNDKDMTSRCKALSVAVENENGLEKCNNIINKVVSSWKTGSLTSYNYSPQTRR